MYLKTKLKNLFIEWRTELKNPGPIWFHFILIFPLAESKNHHLQWVVPLLVISFYMIPSSVTNISQLASVHKAELFNLLFFAIPKTKFI
jgi:hypothetical protein